MAPEFGKPIHQLPLIPANVLKKRRVHEPLDPRFRAAARLLQSIWREDRGLPIGSYVNEAGKRRKLGSRISEAAGKAGGNFLTPEIAHTARREAAYREIGALINLLSSMPLAFNLLAPWGHSLERASGYLIELLPAFTGAARQLLFEHLPGRGNPKFNCLADRV
jgi:PD-(D/E)XK nuclease superfamily protein